MTDRPIHAATIREWRDISSAALPPGWVNVYELPNGRVNWLPCPGVLTQELIGKCTYYSDRTFEDSEPGDDDFNPETRIVFAVPRGLRPQPPNGQHQPNCPTLIPADDGGDPEDIYLATVTADDAEANWGAI